MKRREIARKFDEIVEFAGVEQFIDTPVKRYSSGMYVRLAFAVAAHLEPEILLVDEVLAVGDAEFQRVPREDGGPQRVRAHGALRLAQHAGGRAALRPRDPASTRRVIVRRAERGGRRALSPDGSAAGSDRVVDRRSGAPGQRARRLRAVRVVEEDGERMRRVDVREPVGIEITLRGAPGGVPVFPKIKLSTAGRHRLQRARHRRRWDDPSPSRRLRLDRVDPGEPPERGSLRPSTSRSARSARRSSSTHFGAPARSRSTSMTRGRATPRRASSPASCAASSGRCSTGRPSPR